MIRNKQQQAAVAAQQQRLKNLAAQKKVVLPKQTKTQEQQKIVKSQEQPKQPKPQEQKTVPQHVTVPPPAQPQEIKPDLAIAKFCEAKSLIDIMDQRMHDAVDPIKEQQTEVKNDLIEWMKSNEFKVLQLPQMVDKTDGSVVYRSLRLGQTTSNRAITLPVVKNAIADFMHTETAGPSVINLADEELVRKVHDHCLTSVYQHVRKQCTMYRDTISVQTKRRAPKVDHETVEKQQQLDRDDLVKLAERADTYVTLQKQTREKQKHYNDAKKIYTKELKRYEPAVQQFLKQKSAEVAQISNSKRATNASQNVAVLTDSTTDAEMFNVGLRKKYIAPETTNEVSFEKPTKPLTYKILRALLDAVITKRIEKYKKRGVQHVSRDDWHRAIATDMVHQVEYYMQTKERIVNKLKQDPDNFTTAVCVRRAPKRADTESKQNKRKAVFIARNRR